MRDNRENEWLMEDQPVLFHLGDILAITHDLPTALVERPPLPNGETVPQRMRNAIRAPLGKILKIGPDGNFTDLPHKPWSRQYSDSPFSVAGLYEIAEHLADGTTDFLSIRRVADEAKPVLLEALPFLREIKPPKSKKIKKAGSEFLLQWLKEREAQYGSYHPVLPLKDYKPRSPEEEMEYLGIDPAKLVGLPIDGQGEIGAYRNALFRNVSMEELLRMGDTEFPVIAQTVFALSKIGNPPLVIQPEDIKQSAEEKGTGKIIVVNLDTQDVGQADRKFTTLNQHFERMELSEHLSLKYDSDETGSYVIEVNAEALSASNIQEKLMSYTQGAVKIGRRRNR